MFRVTPPPRKLPTRSNGRDDIMMVQQKKKKKKKNGDDGGEDDDNVSGGGSSSKSKGKSNSGKYENDDDDEDEEDKDSNEDEDKVEEMKEMRDEELIEECTDDHIKLDRPYMMDDIYDTDIYKVLPRIFYYQPFFYLRRKLIETYPSQKFIAIMAITQHKYSALLERFRDNFDAESESYSSLQKRIDFAKKKKYDYLNSSRSIVQMNYGFTLQKRVFAVLKTIVLTGTMIMFIKRC